MWSFIIAMLTLIVLLSIRGNERSNRSYNRSRYGSSEKMLEESDQFFKDWGVTNEVEDIASENVYRTHCIYEKLKQRMADDGVQDTDGFWYGADLAYYAQYGMISKRCRWGIEGRGASYDTAARKRSVSSRKFFEWYDMELRKHGFPYKLIFVNEVTRQADLVENYPPLAPGRYGWYPDRFGMLIDYDKSPNITQENCVIGNPDEALKNRSKYRDPILDEPTPERHYEYLKI